MKQNLVVGIWTGFQPLMLCFQQTYYWWQNCRHINLLTPYSFNFIFLLPLLVNLFTHYFSKQCCIVFPWTFSYRQATFNEGGGVLSMIWSVVETGVLFYTCIGLFKYVSSHFDADCNMDSLLYQTFILVFSSPSTKGLSTECKRWKDTVLSSLSKGIYLQAKLHHHYQQIGTSSQQTHISQASMEMWSKVDQENLKTIIQLQC